MNVQPAGLRVVGEAAVARRGELGRRLGAAADRACVVVHPTTHAGEPFTRTGVELAARGRPDIEQQVAALAHRIDQHGQYLVEALPRGLIAEIAP